MKDFASSTNLKLISNATGNVVASQVDFYINEYNLNEVYQSAYKKNH